MEKHGEKRQAEPEGGILHDVKAILLEVEGTTTPISYFKEKLLGYVKENTKEYLTTHFAEKDLQDIIDGLRKQAKADIEAKVEEAVAIPATGAPEADVVKAVVDNLNWQVNKGQMNDHVRKLVGNIWGDGYKKKAIVGELFDDVVPVLKKLTEQGLKVYVFSTKCSDSQRLLFTYTKDGDLSEMISGFFDMTSGSRTEKDTYAKIAKDIELSPADVLYLTHQPTEATAAHAAGMKTCLAIRPGNPKLTNKDLETFATISSFVKLTGGDVSEVPQKKVCHEQVSPQMTCHMASQAHVEAAKEAK